MRLRRSRPQQVTTFSELRLDTHNQCLLQGSREVPLRPKTFAVLRHLVENYDRLVTKEQILDTVWPGSYVSEMVLKVSIYELRKALGDDSKKPLFIQTRHRRGYRLIGRISLV